MYNSVKIVFLQEHYVKLQPARSSDVTSSNSITSCTSSVIKANASCGTGFCHTGANDCLCRGVGPNSRSTARCLGVLYPLCDAKPYAGNTTSHSRMMRSRSTLARIDAAAIEADSASP